jgi:hypothetical protein
MSNPKDREPHSASPPSPPGADSKRSGRAGVDERGNSVWEWQLETGVYSRDISTQKLRKLDLGDLSIAETASHERPSGVSEGQSYENRGGQRKKAGGGFNPYDNSSGGGDAGANPYDNARNFSKKLQQPSSPAPARKPMDLKRLDEWMQIKKRLEENKKDDDE